VPLPARMIRTALAATAALATLMSTATPALAHDELGNPHSKGISASSHPIGAIARTLPSGRLMSTSLKAATAGTPSVVNYSTKLTRNPDTAALNEPGFTTPADPCAAPTCKEISVNIPAGDTQTLYARAGWALQAQYVDIWGIDPKGSVVGQANVDSKYEKTTGNSDATPIAEFTVEDPKPGIWRIQVRAVYGVNIPVTGYVALTKGAPLVFPRLDVRELADRYLTQHLTYNIVFVNRRWTKAEVAAFESYLPLEYRSAVLAKAFSDGGGSDNGTEGVRNWQVTHYGGTDGAGGSGNKPYFEPLKFTYSHRFLQADSTWTKDLFAAMQKATTKDSPYSTDEAKYLAAYNSNQGAANRGAAAVVDPTKGDKIDAFAVEDWIFAHRYDAKYRSSFRDVKTGKSTSGAFISPDPGAYYDPYYTASGKKNLDRLPQGPSTSLTFFAMDTFNTGENAIVQSDKYFRSSAWHTFDVSKHMIDPDTHVADGPDYSRVWGGRYRFFMHDLGAAPNYYEAVDFFLGTVPGSASYPDGDPPIWDYDNDPRWQGKLAERTARDAVTWLFGRMTTGYLYRPVPADVYYVANNNWVDCYSNPECSPDGVSHTDLEKVYDANYVAKNLGAALPGVTFTTEKATPAVKTFRYLGCAANRALANPDPALAGETPLIEAPDPNCVGKKSDLYQEALEHAKSRGDELVGAGVNDAAVNPMVFRQFVEEHRATIAPLVPGQFTVTNVSVVFPGASTWALPAIVGGIAFGTPNDEGWGILNNINDRVKYYKATDCAKSKPFAPGCNGVPPLRDPGSSFSYVIEHESSHFLGLLHPHDMLVVEKDAKGKWQYYGDTYRHYGDFSMAPTTYAGAFAPYSVLDQDTIQRGHTAEYLRQMQDYLSDAYHRDGAKGLTKPSALTLRKQTEATKWRTQATALFACGDYLHSERAMRNAALTSQGIFGPIVAPRQLKPGQKALFLVNPQPVYGLDGKKAKGCMSGRSAVPPKVIGSGGAAGVGTAPSGSLAATGLGATLPATAALALLAGLVVRRRRTA
jgi:hypothetical protein